MKDGPSAVLYGMRTGNCFRAAIALEEAGIPYEARWNDPRNPRGAEVEYSTLNATGKVPTLIVRDAEDRKFVLTQSNAIVVFAAETSPRALLPGEHLKSRARVFERYFYFLTDVIAPSHAGFSLRDDDVPKAMAILSDRALMAIATADGFLADGSFMAGDRFSIADIAAFTIARALTDGVPWDRLPRLRRWFAAIAERPTVRRGLEAFSPPA